MAVESPQHLSHKVRNMSFFCRLTRRHYWCTPHRSAADNRLIQVCYECGAERLASDFSNEISTEWLKHSMASAKAELANLPTKHSAERSVAHSTTPEPVAVGQRHTGKLFVVK